MTAMLKASLLERAHKLKSCAADLSDAIRDLAEDEKEIDTTASRFRAAALKTIANKVEATGEAIEELYS